MNHDLQAAAPTTPAERWILALADPTRSPWLERLQRHEAPLARWRLKHGLVRVVSGGQLPAAVQTALAAGAPQVHVHSTLGYQATAAACAVPDAATAYRMDVRLLDEERPTDAQALLGALARPDPAVLAHHLLGGRQHWLLHPHEGCLQALQAWGHGFEAEVGAGTLDDLFAPSAMPDVSDPPVGGAGWRALNLPQQAFSDFDAGLARQASNDWLQPLAAGSRDSGSRTRWKITLPDGLGSAKVEFFADNPIPPEYAPLGGSLMVWLPDLLRDATGLWLALLPAGLHARRRLPLGDASKFIVQRDRRVKGIALENCNETLAQAICSGLVMLEWRPAPPPAA